MANEARAWCFRITAISVLAAALVIAWLPSTPLPIAALAGLAGGVLGGHLWQEARHGE